MSAVDRLDLAMAEHRAALGIKARTWDLRSTGARPLTVNEVSNLHRMVWAKHTAQTRQEWWGITVVAKVPKLKRARITVLPLHADLRSPQDVAACAPHAKAAIDGIVDAGVLPDDGPTHLIAITFLPPVVCGENGLHLRIEEA